MEQSGETVVVGAAAVSAHDAYMQGDAAASKTAHDRQNGPNAAHEPEKHGSGSICGWTPSDYVKSIVFGGLDGIVSVFALVASVNGSSLPLEVLLLTGFAKLLGDAISMGCGDALSEQAEHSFIRGEHKRETWEMENYPEGEVAEMIELYQSKGFTPEEAAQVVAIMNKRKEYQSYFVGHMLVQEVGQLLPSPDDSPVKNGLTAFFSFMIFGGIPLWPYVGYYVHDFHDSRVQFGISILLTGVTLMLLGAAQAVIIRGSLLKQSLLMLINGGLAAAASYLIAWGIHEAVGVAGCD